MILGLKVGYFSMTLSSIRVTLGWSGRCRFKGKNLDHYSENLKVAMTFMNL